MFNSLLAIIQKNWERIEVGVVHPISVESQQYLPSSPNHKLYTLMIQQLVKLSVPIPG
jgi:hypothetical protein